jgi:hypothetical protein
LDTSKLVVGQNVFMRSGEVGDWARVVKVTPTGVIVQSDPAYGDELIRFDKNGVACDSSDIGVEEYKDIPLYDNDKGGEYLASDDVDIERVKDVVSQYVEEGKVIPRATSANPYNVGGRARLRQRFWENFERLKKHSRYGKILSASAGPAKLYLTI